MKEKSDAGILEEVAHLETMRLTVLNRTDFGRQLVITGLTPEFATSRDRHFHELLELRFLFAMLDAEKIDFETLRAIRLTPAGMVHYALLPGEHIAHVTVRFDADMCYYLIGKRFAITVPIRSELEQYGVNPGNLVAALNRFAAGEITDKVHLQLLIANLLSALALFLAHGQYKSMSAPEEIICNYIHENYYRNDLTIPEIARVSGFSKNYIQKVFRRSHQCTPMEYLTSVRLDSAQRLLKQHRYQVKEVAAMCGWNYPHYFCRCYRRRYGHAPSEE